jgi:hypothetical protein
MFAIRSPFSALALVLAIAGCSDGGDTDAGSGGRDGSAGREGGDAGNGAAAGKSGASGSGSGVAGAAGSAGADGTAGASGAGGGENGGGGAGMGGTAGGGAQSACNPSPQEHEHDSLPAEHVPAPLPASSYNSSPPSSGPHCGSWGSYAVYEASPLPACNFLHNLEHGAVALLYNCPDGCADVVAALEQILGQAPDDPDCGAAKRLLLTPYGEMDATIAAAAWGYTWTADCLDDSARASLLEFIAAHLGSRGDAPESAVCANGSIAP